MYHFVTAPNNINLNSGWYIKYLWNGQPVVITKTWEERPFTPCQGISYKRGKCIIQEETLHTHNETNPGRLWQVTQQHSNAIGF